MMMLTVSRLALVGAALAFTGPVIAQSAQLAEEEKPIAEAQRGDDQDEALALPVIVVTANRRSESLQDVPAAVTALSGETLEAQSAASFTDFARSIPGLSFSDAGTGRQQPSIRGVNAIGIGGATVGYYIDEAPLPANGGSLRLTNMDPSLYDLDRVEVLRGPQGTLYGSGSMGGTIKIVPNRPALGFTEASARLKGEAVDGGDGLIDAAAMINFPIAPGRLGMRTTGWIRTGGGFIDRYAGDRKVADVPDEETFGFRSSLAWEPSSRFRADASVFHQQQRFNGFQSVTFEGANPAARLQQNFLFDVEERNKNKFTLYNLTLNGSMHGIDILSSSNLYHSSYTGAEETSAVLDTFFAQPTSSAIFERNSQRVFSQEIRLSSARRDRTLDWLIGGFIERQSTKRFVDWTVPGFAPYAGDDLLYLENSSRENDQNALFGEVTLRPAKTLSVTAGLRYFDFSSDGIRAGDGVFNGGPSYRGSDPSSATNPDCPPVTH